MFRVLWLLKRKPGISFEQFRDHYENSHSELGKRYIGHLMTAYLRHYDPANGAGLPASDHDCIAEWRMHDEAAFHEAMLIIGDPEVSRIFLEDETHFLDSASTRLVMCDTRDTGVVPNRAGRP